MLFLRTVVLVMLAAGLACFVIYATTGNVRFRVLGVRIVSWTIVAGLVFFGVLFLERAADFF
jgi:hypothetical protein